MVFAAFIDKMIDGELYVACITIQAVVFVRGEIGERIQRGRGWGGLWLFLNFAMGKIY